MEFKKTTCYHVFSAIKKWKITATIFLFDVLFGVCLFAAAKLFDTIFEQNETAFVGTAGGYLLLLGYFLIIVFVHSFFKYCLFDCFREIEKNKNGRELEKTAEKFTFKRVGIFYAWNLMTYSLLGSGGGVLYLFFVISLVDVLKQPALIVLGLTLILGGYLFVQTSHLIFFENQFKNKELSLKQIPRRVWQDWELKTIGRWIAWNVFFVFVFFVVYFLLYLGIVSLAQKAETNTAAMNEFYLLNIIIFGFLVLYCYFLILWNRVYLLITFSNSQTTK